MAVADVGRFHRVLQRGLGESFASGNGEFPNIEQEGDADLAESGKKLLKSRSFVANSVDLIHEKPADCRQFSFSIAPSHDYAASVRIGLGDPLVKTLAFTRLSHALWAQRAEIRR